MFRAVNLRIDVTRTTSRRPRSCTLVTMTTTVTMTTAPYQQSSRSRRHRLLPWLRLFSACAVDRLLLQPTAGGGGGGGRSSATVYASANDVILSSWT